MAPSTSPYRRSAPWGWAISGIVAGLMLAVAVFAPARWLAAGVEQASNGRIVLADPLGTVWSGSARLHLTGGTGSVDAAILPSRLDWTVRPGWDGLRLTARSACCIDQPVKALASPRWGGARLALDDSRSQWPASLLAGLGTPWNTLQPEGVLALATQGLSVEWVEGRLGVSGSAELQAQRMSSRLSTLRPMGSYRFTLTGGNLPQLQLQTLEGALRLSGSGQWVGSRLRFSGVAEAAPEREAALSNLLNIIGRRSGARSIISVG